jgi:hypothetical protein
VSVKITLLRNAGKPTGNVLPAINDLRLTWRHERGSVVFTIFSEQQMVMHLLCVREHAFKAPQVSKLQLCFQLLFNLGRAVLFRSFQLKHLKYVNSFHNCSNLGLVKSYPITCLDRPLGFQEVEAPTFHDSRHMKVVRVSPTHRPPLPPGNIPGTQFC